jgi:ankyrin repeat protein
MAPIHDAIRHDDLQAVIAFVSSSTDCAILHQGDNFNGASPLQTAAEHGRKLIAQYLLAARANMSELNEDEDMLLTYAVIKNYVATVQLLVQHGANARHRNTYKDSIRKTAIGSRQVDPRIDTLIP